MRLTIEPCPWPPRPSAVVSKRLEEERKMYEGRAGAGRDQRGEDMPLLKRKRGVQRLSRSLSRFETQDIKTQPQFNHYLFQTAVPGRESEDDQEEVNGQGRRFQDSRN